MNGDKKEAHGEFLGRICQALQFNGIKALWVPDRASALEKALSLIKNGDTVGIGGSVTLEEIGLLAALRRGDIKGIKFYDAYQKGLPRDEALSLRHKSLSASIFFSGTNAITEAGELVNMDGFGNRVAALVFGPGRVCVVAGSNKIVRDIPSALSRIKTIAAPLNCRRLGRMTPCRETGVCDEKGCAAPERICNVYSVIRRKPGGADMTVILVAEKLGY